MDDLISRQEATEALMMMQGIVAKEGVRKGISMAWQQIKDLPSAQLEQQWIPCSERLPSARQSVILSTKEWTGEGCYWETTEHHVIWKGYRWNATYWDDEVIAWMPLPEPARLERD